MRKKVNILFAAVLAVVCTTVELKGQVTIGSGLPAEKGALLDLKEKESDGGEGNSNRGILFPRVRLTDMNKLAPLLSGSDLDDNNLKLSHRGIIVYNITVNFLFKEGLYSWDGIKWNSFNQGNGDLTQDAWVDDKDNAAVRLGTLSDGTTLRPVGTEFVVKDNGSIGLGTLAPDASAILDVTAINRGMLMPRVSLANPTDQTTIPNPATGLIVYNTGFSTLTYKGFVFWTGTEWRSFNNNTTINAAISDLNCSNASISPIEFKAGVPYNGLLTVPYSGGNGGSYAGVTSFTQNGLTFTMNEGRLNNGNGTITYSVSGTPNFSSPSTVQVRIDFLGHSCEATIGNDGSGFAIGQTKSLRVVVNANAFTTNGGSRNLMTGKWQSNMSTTNRQSAYELASASDKSKFFVLNGLRLDFIESWTNGSVSAKLFNTTASTTIYNISSLSTNDSFVNGGGTEIRPNAYSYSVDGNDDMTCQTGGDIEYVNSMITFPNGEWYNCTWHATRDANSYYLYMTALRLN